MSNSKKRTFSLIISVNPCSNQVPAMLELPDSSSSIPTCLEIGTLPGCPLAALAGEDEEKEVPNVR